MDRQKAYEEVLKNVQERNLIYHMLAAEAVMRGLAERLGGDVEKWGLTGLLHDIDYQMTMDTPEKHGLVGAELLRELGYPEDIIHAVMGHNERLGVERTSLMDKAMYTSDPVTGLIVATALVLPSRKLSDVTVQSIMNKLPKKAFARGVDREQLKTCSELGLSMEEFLEISLNAMQGIASEIGL
jgi:putative nucleotidyltransferase with HDIG domain